jgi:hypothetical protein
MSQPPHIFKHLSTLACDTSSTRNTLLLETDCATTLAANLDALAVVTPALCAGAGIAAAFLVYVTHHDLGSL